MAEFTKDGKRLITVVRVLEYHGTEEWIVSTLENSRIPTKGEFRPNQNNGDIYIRSGLVEWDVVNEEGELNPPATPTPIVAPPDKVM